MGWIGVDLDGTLAEWGEGTSNPEDVLRVGDPIPAMIARVQAFLEAGQEVRIFTARVGPATEEECLYSLDRLDGYARGPLPQRDWDNYQRTLIETWCQTHLGCVLPITCTKDFHMWMLYDDRCVQVIPNTGETLDHRIAVLEEQVAHYLATLTYAEGE